MSETQPPIEDDSPEWEQHVFTDIGRFAMVPSWILRHPKVTDKAIRLLGIFLSEFGSATQQMYPSRPTLATMLGCSLDTIDRAVANLVEQNILTVIPRTRPNGSSTSNVYRLRLADPEPQGCEGVAAEVLPHVGRKVAAPRSISNKNQIPRGGGKITEAFHEEVRQRFEPVFMNFERTWRDITNSKYLAGKTDQRQYVLDRFEERVEKGWGTIASPPTNGLVRSLEEEAEALGQVWH